MIALMMLALCSPNASSAMRLALSIVFIPIVIAPAGTSLREPKKWTASSREFVSSRMRRVCDDACEPGSLNPTLPAPPTPSI